MSDDNEVVAASEAATNNSNSDSKSKDLHSSDQDGEDSNSVPAVKESVKDKIVNGDNGNSMDSNSISNGHDEASNGGTVEDEDEEMASNGANDDSTPMVSEPTSPAQKTNNKRKEPQVVRIDEGDDTEGTGEVEDEEESEDAEGEEEEEVADDTDVQEVKDDSSDSDIMEVEAEDPLASGSSSVTISSSVTSTEVKKPQVVTIDDPKTLQKLASSAKSKVDKEKVTIIDTSAILSGRATSGVTITPARPKVGLINAKASPKPGGVIPASLTSSLAASGVTISSKSSNNININKKGDDGGVTPISGSGFVYDSRGQLQDPNLTDDTIVIEAPSFIVPYVYEKPPRETFTDFKTEIKKLMNELKKKEDEEKAKKKDEKGDDDDEDDDEEEKKKKKEKKDKKKKKPKKKSKDDGSGDEDNGDREDDDDYNSEDEDAEASDSDDSDIAEIRPKSPELPEVKKPNENFFESTLGKMITDLGMNLVQEAVQRDLLKQQQRKAQKDKSAAVMHAIASLKHNIEQSKENNQHFHHELKRCKLCSFKTESDLALAHHLEAPHSKNGMFRCNFCHFETKLAHEVIGHMQGFHEVKPRIERPPSIHQCPQCPFEDMMKGKLTRHKVGCDKRFRAERNQEPPHDWDPPAKIPKPPQSHRGGVAGVSVLNAQGRAQNLTAIRGALSQFNQQGLMQQAGRYSAMPALQFGPGAGRGVGRPPNFNKPFIPNRTNANQRTILPAFATAQRLAGNPSVTIQSISKTGGLKSNNPSISITPVPGGRNPASAGLKPGAPSSGGGKDSFVICEICDGYIRDLEQLRNHMQFIHKVKIHPKMIYNRPPLNCQKCQFRFFTDQGLERHLLGSHGLVTASMQDLANKGQDSGRCPVCGKMFHWKLLNHVAKDHMKTLKPAHLSYKCTVCTATFGQYKLFETHVYSAHSGGRKNVGKPAPKPAAKPFKMSDEITIIPQGKNVQKPSTPTNKKTPPASKKPARAADDDIIELDDEEEIDDVEEQNDRKKNGSQAARKRKSEAVEDSTEDSQNAKSSKTSAASSAAEDSGEEGVEEIRDDEPEEDDD